MPPSGRSTQSLSRVSDARRTLRCLRGKLGVRAHTGPDRADLTYVPPDGTKLGDTYDGQVLAARLDRDPEIQPPYADWAPDLAALAPQMTAMARKMNEVMNELCKIMEPVAKAIEDLSELFAEALDNNQEDVEK